MAQNIISIAVNEDVAKIVGFCDKSRVITEKEYRNIQEFLMKSSDRYQDVTPITQCPSEKFLCYITYKRFGRWNSGVIVIL